MSQDHSYKSQQFSRGNSTETNSMSVEFRPSDPTDMVNNPERVWINTVNDSFTWTMNGVDFNSLTQSFIDVKSYPYHAKGDGVTDDTTAIQAAINYGFIHNIPVIAVGTFKITSKIVIKGNFNGDNAIFKVYNTPSVGVEVSTGNASNPTTYTIGANIHLPVIQNMTKPGVGWAGQGTGLRIVNALQCNIYIQNVIDFAVGAHITSNASSGNAYNNYFIQTLENNQVNLKLQALDTTSWVNENNFYGGRFAHYSGEGTNVVGVRQIQIKNFSAASLVINSNVFYKPSIEGNTPEYHVEIEGSYNEIIAGRWEAATPKLLINSISASSGKNNIILHGYKSETIVTTIQGIAPDKNQVIPSGEGMKLDIDAPIRLSNVSSSAASVLMGFAAGTSSLNKDPSSTDWLYSLSGQWWKGKRAADANERIKHDFVNGRTYYANGTAPVSYYVGDVNGTMGVSGSNFTIDGGTFNTGHLQLGNYHLWVDVSGRLRIKNGAPTSDTDGVVVGTQA